jgi:hypothetical protein
VNIDWLDPWKPITDPDLARAFEGELARELAPGHALAGLPLQAIGQHGGTDDFLFQVNDGSGRVALAHLTWSGRRETPPWPESLLFSSVAEWVQQGMRLDHEETRAWTMGG